MRRALELAGAPADLVAWAVEAGRDDAWDGCDRGDWLVYLAACAPLPLDDILLAARAAIAHAVQAYGDATAPIATLLAELVDDANHELSDAVLECEAAAEGARAGYRSGEDAGFTHAAHAAALIARAAEALHAARAVGFAMARAEALDRGMGIPAWFEQRAQGDALLIPDMIARSQIQQELAFVTAATAEAMHHAAVALARGQDGEPLEDAEGALSDMLHEKLTPLREPFTAWS